MFSAVSTGTLSNQARAARLPAVKPGQTRVVTGVWLHEYLLSRERRQGRRKPLPADYGDPRIGPQRGRERTMTPPTPLTWP
jgi:hypothetical protein